MSLHFAPPPISQQSMADLLCTIIVLCKAKDEHGQPFWAYLCIKPSMAESFREARAAGTVNLEEFGTILESGKGAEVPLEVMRRMERDYGVRHNFEQLLLDAIEARRRSA